MTWDEKVIPGSFNAFYIVSAAFVVNFTDALRYELKEYDNVTLTTLMPGGTDTEFFARAHVLNIKVDANEQKADPAKVARDGWDAMIDGKDRIVSGLMNKLQIAVAGIVPPAILAGMRRKLAEPQKVQ